LLNIDGLMRKFEAGREVTFKQLFKDNNNEKDCSSVEWVCYYVKSKTETPVPANTVMKFMIVGTQNQVSMSQLGNYYI